MKIQVLSLIVAASSAPMAAAFAPPASSSSRRPLAPSSKSTSKLSAAIVDPSSLLQHVDSLQHVLSSMALADLDSDAVADAAAIAASSGGAGAMIAPAADAGNGWFGFLTLPIEFLLQLIHSTLANVGLSSNAWGVSIIGMTVVIKLLTFPLTKSQLESTNKMQVREERRDDVHGFDREYGISVGGGSGRHRFPTVLIAHRLFL
jgi:YidC/Oxa1 family membrane protein insertase